MAQEGDSRRCDVYEIFLDQLASICFPEDARTNSINVKYLPLFILIYGLAARHSKATAHENDEDMCFVKAWCAALLI